VNLSKTIIEYFNDSFSEDTEILNLALERYASLKTNMLQQELFKCCDQDDVEHIKDYNHRLGNLIIRELALRDDYDLKI
jgi:hypothetical protein